MRDCHTENRTSRSERKMSDIRSSEFDSSKQHFNKVVDGCEFGDGEVDNDYAWLLSTLTNTNEQTKSVMVEAIGNEDEDEDEDEYENAKDIDPQYCMFLKELTENGKSYKLKISKNDEAPKFLVYEEQDKSDGYEPPTYTTFSIGNNGDKENSSEGMGDRQINHRVKKSLQGRKGEISTTKEISRKKKIKEHKFITDSCHDTPVDSCYWLFLNSKDGAFSYEGKQANSGEKATSSDSDILIWDNVHDCSEVNNKQPVTAKKDPSLKEQLMQILRQPYNRKEYEELAEYVEEEKPICRLLPLRCRTISSAMDGLTKSVLDNVPGSFRKKLEAAQNERPRALNLLRMFRFWLEHLPNEDVFQPWLDDDCLKVLPSARWR